MIRSKHFILQVTKMNLEFILKVGNKLPQPLTFNNHDDFMDYIVTNGPFQIKKQTGKPAELIGYRFINPATYLDVIINEIKGFRSETIVEGKKPETHKERLIDMYIGGVNHGYNEAVKQIIEHFERMK